MAKVGIATFQFADNYGAVLQAYALKRTIEKMGVETHVINYIPIGFRYMQMWSDEIQRKKWLNKRDKFNNFLFSNCGITEQVTTITGEDYDFLFAGSDQIWGPKWYDKNYFFLNVRDRRVKKNAYAASMGLSVKICAPYGNDYKENVRDFRFISVRENEHAAFLQMVTGRKCNCVLDPSLLLDADEYCCDERYGGESYVFLFWLPHQDDYYKGIRIANKLAKRNGFKIMHNVFDPIRNKAIINGEDVSYVGIEEFLGIIKNAKYVVTNSYHCTIFSIQYGIHFYTDFVDRMSLRFSTLLSYSEILRKCKVENGVWAIDNEINIFEIREEILQYRSKSLDFLRAALELIPGDDYV